MAPDLSDRPRRKRAAFWPLREQLHAMNIKTFFKGKLYILNIEDGDAMFEFASMSAAKKGLRGKYPDIDWNKKLSR